LAAVHAGRHGTGRVLRLLTRHATRDQKRDHHAEQRNHDPTETFASGVHAVTGLALESMGALLQRPRSAPAAGRDFRTGRGSPRPESTPRKTGSASCDLTGCGCARRHLHARSSSARATAPRGQPAASAPFFTPRGQFRGQSRRLPLQAGPVWRPRRSGEIAICFVKRRNGGEAGIRTLGTAFRPYNGLANRRLQPLGHLTVRGGSLHFSPSPKAKDGLVCPPVCPRRREASRRSPSLTTL
jgi:hypothetical protein